MAKQTEKLPVERTETLPAAITPMDMLQKALEQNADLDKMQQLMDLQERWEKTQAKKAFVAAMQTFKANPPIVVKDRHVRFQTSKGVTEYDHASHAQVVTVIGEALAKVGITHRWEVKQEADRIGVTCILTHVDGHSDCTSLYGGSDASGGKNSIQAIGSTVTYLQRYTLLSATGIAVQEDDDGAITEQPIAELVNDEQLSELTDMIDATGTDRKKFLEFYKVDRLEDMGVAAFKHAKRALSNKQEKKNADS